MNDLHELELLLRSSTPVIVIETVEEVRLLQLLKHLSPRLPQPLFQWSVTEGVRTLGLSIDPQEHTAGPTEALRYIKGMARPTCFVMLDFHPYLQDPVHVRLVKEIAQGFEFMPRTLVFVSHAFEIPREIKHFAVRIELRLPNREALIALVQEEIQSWQTRRRGSLVRIDQNAMDRLVENLLGVNFTDARRIIRNAIEHDGAITHNDLPEVMRAKYQLIEQEGIIAFEYDTARFADIGGLNHLKQWLLQRQVAFSGQAGTLDTPRGLMLIGVQGCGKSLAAKAVAGTFGVPLLRLDFGALYNKYIGETEKNLRQALKTAEVMSPCILWMDEVEKGIAPSDGDEGSSRRVLGTLLTWMAERKARVFIVATANEIERMPPELIRKGRLDEIFFVDLPELETRREIFSIHLRRRNLAPSRFDLGSLAKASGGFSGAEIEQSIVSAMYAAQSQNLDLNTGHILQELHHTRPLSVVMEEHIQELRDWAAERTVPAG